MPNSWYSGPININDMGTPAKGDLVEVINNALGNAFKYLEDKIMKYVNTWKRWILR